MPLLTFFGWRTALWAVAALVAAFMAAGPLLELRSLRGQVADLRAELGAATERADRATERAEGAEREVALLRQAVADHLERVRRSNAAVAQAEAKRKELERMVERARRAKPTRRQPNTVEPAHAAPDPVDDVLRRLRDQERAHSPDGP